jgi:exodeoxyribonuclease V alpha subunit
MDSLSGSVMRITFYNEENGYSVIKLQPDEEAYAQDSEGLVTVTGTLPELSAGEYLSLRGEWQQHPKFGLQFNAETLEQARPVTLEGLRRYLGSGMLKGIGPAIAKRIVERFGLETIEVIEQQPQRLRQVPDIGPKRLKQIVDAWEAQKQVRAVMIFLHGHGVSSNLATKIYKHYGDEAMRVVEEDPYQLARDIYGVGFKTADKIAQSLGLPAEHPTRLEAGLVHTLNELVGDGHVFAPRDVLLQRAGELLAAPQDLINEAIGRLAEQGLAVVEARDGAEEAIYPEALHRAEVGAAEQLQAMVEAEEPALAALPALELLPLESELSQEQLGAVQATLKNPVSVLTGGPGTGKTTAMKALIAAVEAGGKKYALASPTGRAAKRLGQATDRTASTIHRLLGFSPGEGYKFDEDDPLELDLLVVDEASMLDLQLAHALLRALKPGTHLLLVGDVDQLPSVGAGDVLREIIASGITPVTRLTEIFRQAAGSEIIANAHHINQGEMPVFAEQGEDFFLFPAKEAEKAADWVVDLVTERIPGRFKLDAASEIQVLAPMYRGAAGVNALNERLQAALNPASPLKAERNFFGSTYRVGDRLMQVRNDYDKGVFNGDIGILKTIDADESVLTVDFEGRAVEYDFSEGDQLTLAYAVTVHKAQGSEFPCVVLPVLTAQYVMLQRNLLYTAITRAERLCVLVGDKRAIAMAVKNNQVAQRWSGLAGRLAG